MPKKSDNQTLHTIAMKNGLTLVIAIVDGSLRAMVKHVETLVRYVPMEVAMLLVNNKGENK